MAGLTCVIAPCASMAMMPSESPVEHVLQAVALHDQHVHVARKLIGQIVQRAAQFAHFVGRALVGMRVKIAARDAHRDVAQRGYLLNALEQQLPAERHARQTRRDEARQ